jgi:hypothetical protein
VVANKQVLTYSVRLPDAAQADALRLLDASRTVVNQTILLLWPRLTEFADRPYPQTWKHVTDLIDSPDPHGNRQWRCEAETAGASCAPRRNVNASSPSSNRCSMTG